MNGSETFVPSCVLVTFSLKEYNILFSAIYSSFNNDKFEKNMRERSQRAKNQ